MRFSGREMIYVYTGLIFIKETGTNLHTGEQTVTVCWQYQPDDPLQEVTIPHTSLSDVRDFGAAIGGAGTIVHAENRGKVAGFLTEFAAANAHGIPHHHVADRLGLDRDRPILVLPDTSIGTNETVRCTSRASVVRASNCRGVKRSPKRSIP
jgi:hypothetical protein